MARIAVIGGTGYAGRHVVEEAVRRGHDVVSIARKPAAERIPGATYAEGSLLDVPGLVAELQGADVVYLAVAPLAVLRPAVVELVAALPDDVRVGITGGAGGSLVSPGGPRLVDTDDFPEEFKPEALQAAALLGDLQRTPASRDWFYLHPAGGFGAWAPGERTGSYRDGGEVLVVGENGESFISGADFAVAVLDEIETPRHRRERFAVGY